MNHGGCGQTIDEVSGTPTMLEKHQWAKCTDTPSMCTGTLEQKSGSGKSVPVHLQCILVHLSRKVTVAKVYRYTINVYRYTCMKITGIEKEFDPNVSAHLSINLGCDITLERGIKTIGYKEKAAFDH